MLGMESQVTLKQSFQKVLVRKAKDEITPEELEAMSMAELLAYKTVTRVVEKPTTLDVLNLAKLSGEQTDTVNVTLTGIDKVLADCKQSDES